ncbi:ABC transporter substrate-binding protein [Viridibacillus sp. YIM B01967]|uniref:ABC transporter substrate-binding protein n=1 Tax=Viridibacillus soli TaxID=2798301 RepID=A0ABS1HA93_9BACL|nr:ABC transporter substrate-binding protein [Viridibacillus soli]MBK3496339.1 ABC transporter substrate-binding protein [Viridibacillus soli]
MTGYRKLWISISLLVIIMLSACSSSDKPSKNEGTKQKAESGYGEVVITNMDHEFTYTEAPKRAVALNQHATEIMLALGLQDSMVGTAYLDDKILPEFKEAYEKIPVLAKEYPSKEVFFEVEPDFAYAGWRSAFSEQTLGTVEELQEAGVNTYIQESSSMSTTPTLDDVYKDIENIGRIFHVEKRATELINQMKQDMEETIAKVGRVEEPVNVLVYDSGEEVPMAAAKDNYLVHLVTMAGGNNIFNDTKGGWPEVSWEEIINRNPEAIIIIDYGDTSVEQKQKFLLNKKELADLPAIKNKIFIVLPLSAGAEGIRAPLALKTVAEGLYPEKFEK